MATAVKYNRESLSTLEFPPTKEQRGQDHLPYAVVTTNAVRVGGWKRGFLHSKARNLASAISNLTQCFIYSNSGIRRFRQSRAGDFVVDGGWRNFAR